MRRRRCSCTAAPRSVSSADGVKLLSWPDEEHRIMRIRRDLSESKTWLVLDGTAVAGTITIDPTDNENWPAQKRGKGPSTSAG